MERITGLLCLLLFVFQANAREPISKQDAAQIISDFQRPINVTEASNDAHESSWDDCWTYDKELDVEEPLLAGENLRLQMRLYVPNRDDLKDSKVPMVIMIPPVGGINYLDKQMAKSFCRYGVAAALLANDFANIDHQAKKELLPPDDHQKTFYRVAAGVKASMLLADDDPNIDYEQIGLFGVSLGGILSSFVMSTQPDIVAGYFMVAGGDIPDILAYSEQDEVKQIRQRRMKEQNFETQEEYEAFLRQHISLDPLDVKVTMIPETLKMVIAEQDSSVPTDNQMLLYDAYGQPEADFYNDGHVGTVIAGLLFGGKRRRVVDFFKEQFERGNVRRDAFDFLDQFSLVAM